MAATLKCRLQEFREFRSCKSSEVAAQAFAPLNALVVSYSCTLQLLFHAFS
jgi:hypothetical protein